MTLELRAADTVDGEPPVALTRPVTVFLIEDDIRLSWQQSLELVCVHRFPPRW
jgi:hypothetical protein